MDNINWAGLKPRNVFADYAAGAEAGQEMRATNLKREAANLFATDPEGAEKKFIAAGDIASAEAIRKRREAQSAKNHQGLLGVVAQTKGPEAAQMKAVQVGQTDLAKMYGEMSETQRKQGAERAGVLVAYLDSFQGKSEAEIAAQLQEDAPGLMELGFTREQIANFRPNPMNIARLRAQALGLKGHLDQADKDRNFDLRRTDTAADNTRADAQLQVSRDQVNIARENLGVRREAHEARLAQQGYGTPGAGGDEVRDEEVEY